VDTQRQVTGRFSVGAGRKGKKGDTRREETPKMKKVRETGGKERNYLHPNRKKDVKENVGTVRKGPD